MVSNLAERGVNLQEVEDRFRSVTHASDGVVSWRLESPDYKHQFQVDLERTSSGYSLTVLEKRYDDMLARSVYKPFFGITLQTDAEGNVIGVEDAPYKIRGMSSFYIRAEYSIAPNNESIAQATKISRYDVNSSGDTRIWQFPSESSEFSHWLGVAQAPTSFSWMEMVHGLTEESATAESIAKTCGC